MLTKIGNHIKYGGLGIEMLYPGLIRPQLKDSGYSTLGRIDHATITPGTLIPMHLHRDDEILTYLRSGKIQHRDSEGYTAVLSNRKVMIMNAGAHFLHEEKVLEEAGVLEGLQIFIRPEVAGLNPRVQLHELADVYSMNQWRKLAGKGIGYPLEIRSDTWVMDMRLEKQEEVFLPEMGTGQLGFLFYVFDGQVEVDGSMLLNKGESVLIENAHPGFKAIETADIILFITGLNADHFDDGMYSGNLQQ
jgi:redox-sensitive bicupin YhaK (pirin superfamily)